MKFDKNEYEGLVRRPLMMVKKSEENSRALALNETVGENYSPTSSALTSAYSEKNNNCKSKILKFRLRGYCNLPYFYACSIFVYRRVSLLAKLRCQNVVTT